METVHKVGEKVKIRSKEWFDEEFKKIRFIVMGANLTKEHRLYCGEEATITHASPFGYRIDIDNERNLWDDFMFESITPAGSGEERVERSALVGAMKRECLQDESE